MRAILFALFIASLFLHARGAAMVFLALAVVWGLTSSEA
jgi:hypothetical protein